MIIDYMTIADAAKCLGVGAHQIRYAHTSGKVREPSWRDGRRAYREEDLLRLRRFFDAKRQLF